MRIRHTAQGGLRLELTCLAQNKTRRRRWGSNPGPLNAESDALLPVNTAPTVLFSGPSPSSGPLCFECQNFDDPITCDRVTLCSAGEVKTVQTITIFTYSSLHGMPGISC